jgi:DNA-binding NarL/FixJ family response regulator
MAQDSLAGLHLVQGSYVDDKASGSVATNPPTQKSVEFRLREALARERMLRREISELIQQQEASRRLMVCQQNAASRVAALTPRQREILELIVAGHPNKIIAVELGVSQRTVEHHRALILKKTGAGSLPGLATLAFIAGWTCPNDTDHACACSHSKPPQPHDAPYAGQARMAAAG